MTASRAANSTVMTGPALSQNTMAAPQKTLNQNPSGNPFSFGQDTGSPPAKAQPQKAPPQKTAPKVQQRSSQPPAPAPVQTAAATAKQTKAEQNRTQTPKKTPKTSPKNQIITPENFSRVSGDLQNALDKLYLPVASVYPECLYFNLRKTIDAGKVPNQPDIEKICKTYLDQVGQRTAKFNKSNPFGAKVDQKLVNVWVNVIKTQSNTQIMEIVPAIKANEPIPDPLDPAILAKQIL